MYIEKHKLYKNQELIIKNKNLLNDNDILNDNNNDNNKEDTIFFNDFIHLYPISSFINDDFEDIISSLKFLLSYLDPNVIYYESLQNLLHNLVLLLEEVNGNNNNNNNNEENIQKINENDNKNEDKKLSSLSPSIVSNTSPSSLSFTPSYEDIDDKNKRTLNNNIDDNNNLKKIKTS